MRLLRQNGRLNDAKSAKKKNENTNSADTDRWSKASKWPTAARPKTGQLKLSLAKLVN